MKTTLLVGASALCLTLNPAIAHAESEFSPQLNGLVSFEIENDWAFDSDDADADVNTLYTTIEPYLILSFNDRLALEAGFVLEPVQDTDPNEDTEFDNEGLYVQELKFTYTDDNFGFFAGKYNPSFGTAWDLAPGIYGADFAIDYELAERIGLGASVSLGSEEAGYYTLTGNSFFLDTSWLSESTITKRGDTDKSDGGISNTEDLSSFSITLDSENFAGAKGLNTHVGYYSQSEGDADVDLDDETAFAVGANYTFPLNEVVEAMVLAEWVGIENLAGSTTEDSDYLTGGVSLTLYDNWNVGASYTSRDKHVSDDVDTNDYVYQLSAGYTWDNGISFDVGYSNREESDVVRIPPAPCWPILMSFNSRHLLKGDINGKL